MVAKSKPGAGKAICPYCKEWVTVGATRCPHCQAEFTEADMKTMKAANKASLIGCGVLALVGILTVGMCSMSDEDEIPATAEVGAKEDAIEFYKEVIGTGSECDKAFTAASKQMADGDIVASYRAAKSAENICLPVAGNIRSLKVPTSVGKDAHAKLTTAKEDCAMVFTNKWAVLGDISDAIDTGATVGKVAAVQDTMDQIQAGTVRCVAGLYTPLIGLGVDMATVKID